MRDPRVSGVETMYQCFPFSPLPFFSPAAKVESAAGRAVALRQIDFSFPSLSFSAKRDSEPTATLLGNFFFTDSRSAPAGENAGRGSPTSFLFSGVAPTNGTPARPRAFHTRLPHPPTYRIRVCSSFFSPLSLKREVPITRAATYAALFFFARPRVGIFPLRQTKSRILTRPSFVCPRSFSFFFFFLLPSQPHGES